VDVRLLREGKEMTLPVTIVEMAGSPGSRPGGRPLLEESRTHGPGHHPEMAKRFEIGDTKGVVVTGVADGSAAEDAGFNEGTSSGRSCARTSGTR